MQRPFRQFTKRLRKISLTKSEHAAMRSRLTTFMEANPRFAEQRRSGFTQFLVINKLYISGALLLLIVLSSGVSYAAENSLPGNVLYALKINVLEPLHGVTAITPEARVQWEVTKVGRRLSEAELLLEKGPLATNATNALAQQVQDHSDSINADIATLREDNKFAAAASATNVFTATLQTHQGLLKQLAARQDSDHQPTPLITTLETQTNGLRWNENAIANQVNASAATESQTAAIDMQMTATNKISDLRNVFAARAQTFDSSTQSQVDEYLSQIDALMSQGQALLDAKKPGDAFLLFQEADRKIQDARLLLDAHKTLGNRSLITIKRSENFQMNTTTVTSTKLMMPAKEKRKNLPSQSDTQGDSGDRNPRLKNLLPHDQRLDDLEMEIKGDD